MWVKVKHYFRVERENEKDKIVDREASVNIEADSDDHPMYWRFPVTLSGSSSGIDVVVTVSSFHVSGSDVEISTDDDRITINSSSKYDIAKIVDDYMDRETR